MRDRERKRERQRERERGEIGEEFQCYREKEKELSFIWL